MTSNFQYLILNQYRSGSSYKDVVGRLYHFPSKYLKSFAILPAWFVYYEPREGGDQQYFGFGRVHTVYEDTEDVEQNYAEISDYVAFLQPVSFYAGPNGGAWENPKTMRNSVRRLEALIFEAIVKAGGLSFPESGLPADLEVLPDALKEEMERLPKPGKRSPAQLRKVRRILEFYERPSSITNQVTESRII